MRRRHFARAEVGRVGYGPYLRLRREDVVRLRDVPLEDVRLDRPAQLRPRYALLLADAEVEGEEHRRRRVDRHRRRDVTEGDPGEERLHVGERIYRYPFSPDLT